MVKMIYFQMVVAMLGLAVPFLVPRVKSLVLMTGFRRDWTAKNTGTCRAMHPDQLIGCEDLHLHVDGEDRILITACTSDMQNRVDWFPAMGHTSNPRAGIKDKLFVWNLNTDVLTELSTTWTGDFVSHGIDVVPTGNLKEIAIYAINHLVSGSVVEKFTHKIGSSEAQHIKTFDDQSIVSTPNDLYVVDEADDLFYVTNDHAYKTGTMRELETLLQFPTTHVAVHSNAHAGYRIAAAGLQCANGLTGDRKDTLFLNHVNARVSVYKYQNNGNLTFERSIVINHGIDNPSYSFETNELIVPGFPAVQELGNFAKRPHELATTSIVSRISMDHIISDSFNNGEGTPQPPVDEFFLDTGTGLMNMSTTAVVDKEGDAWYMTSAFGTAIVKCTGYSDTY